MLAIYIIFDYEECASVKARAVEIGGRERWRTYPTRRVHRESLDTVVWSSPLGLEKAVDFACTIALRGKVVKRRSEESLSRFRY